MPERGTSEVPGLHILVSWAAGNLTDSLAHQTILFSRFPELEKHVRKSYPVAIVLC